MASENSEQKSDWIEEKEQETCSSCGNEFDEESLDGDGCCEECARERAASRAEDIMDARD